MITNETLEIIKSRRSIRKFDGKMPSDEQISAILEAGIWAPSGKNMQSWQFTVLKNPEKLKKLNEAVGKALNNENYGIYGAPMLIIMSNDEDNTNGLADCACAMQNMFLEATAIGVDGCWINQLKITCDDLCVRKLLTEFGIPKNHKVWCAAALGFALTRPHNPPQRKEGTVIFVQ